MLSVKGEPVTNAMRFKYFLVYNTYANLEVK